MLRGGKILCLDKTGAWARTFKTCGDVFSFGSNITNNYIIEDKRALEIHCEIRCDSFGAITMYNKSVEFPVYVNANPVVESVRLEDGNPFIILNNQFIWEYPSKKSKQPVDVDNSQNEELSPCQKFPVKYNTEQFPFIHDSNVSLAEGAAATQATNFDVSGCAAPNSMYMCGDHIKPEIERKSNIFRLTPISLWKCAKVPSRQQYRIAMRHIRDAGSTLTSIPEEANEITSSASTPKVGEKLIIKPQTSTRVAKSYRHATGIGHFMPTTAIGVRIDSPHMREYIGCIVNGTDGAVTANIIPKNLKMRQQLRNQQMPNLQMMNQQMPNQQMLNLQMPNQQMPNQQMPNQQMPNQQMPNQQMPNQQMPNQQMPNQQMPNQQIPNQQWSSQQFLLRNAQPIRADLPPVPLKTYSQKIDDMHKGIQSTDMEPLENLLKQLAIEETPKE